MTTDIRIRLSVDGAQQAQSSLAAASAGVERFAQANAGMTANTKLSGHQVSQLSAQLQDFAIQVQSGQSITTAFLQQGSQLSAVFGGFGNALRAVGSLITPTTVLIGGLGLAVGGVALAYAQGAKEDEAFIRGIVLSGNAAGVTAGQLREMAKAQAATVGTQSQAAQVLAQLAATGNVAAAQMSKASEAAVRFQRSGAGAVEEITKKFDALGRAPLQTLTKLNEAENFLTRSLYDQVKALEARGRLTEAAAVAQSAYADVVISRTTQIEDRLGLLQKGWRVVGDAAGWAWDKMLDVGREQTVEDALAKVQQVLATQRKNRAQEASWGRAESPRDEQERKDAEREEAFLQRILAMQRRAAEGARDLATANKAYVDNLSEALALQAARAQSAFSQTSASINGELAAIESQARRQLISPIEAIEKTGLERVKLIKAEIELANAQVAIAKKREDKASAIAAIEAQAAAKNIELGNATVAVQRAVEEAMFARKKAAEAAYRTEQEEGQAAVDALNNEFARAYRGAVEQVQGYAQSIDDANAALQLEISMLGASDQARDVAIEKLRVEIGLRKELKRIEQTEGLSADQRISLSDDARAAAARATAAAEGKAFLDQWRKTNDMVAQSLTDALMEGGRSARDYLKGLFRTLVLQPIIKAVVDPVSGAIATFVAGGMSASGGSGSAAALAGANNLSTLSSLYQAGTGYSGGVNALAGYLGAGSTAGASALSIGYANAVGAAGGDALGALIAANGSWGGVAAGTSLGSSAAGAGVAAGSGGAGASASSAGLGASSWAGIAAAVVAAWMASSSAWSKGFNNENLTGAFRYSPESTFTDLLKIGGMSEKSANIWGGGAVYTSLFGRASPRITSSGISGQLSAGDFAGQAYADILEKGGLFRSDKRRTEYADLNTDIGTFLDTAAATLYTKAKEFGAALGLPAEQLAGISTTIKVALTDDIEANKTEITKALAGYGDALVEGYASQVAPFKAYGETTAQTIERVGSALVSVNSTLSQLGFGQLNKTLADGTAAIDLTSRFGGTEAFNAAASDFYSAFYSEAERASALGDQLGIAFKGLGLTLPDVTAGAEAARQAYRDQVKAQDLTTESGRTAFATLVQLSGAFNTLVTAAAAVQQQRDELEGRLLQAQGNTVELRNRERAAIDATNRALFDQVAAAEAARQAADQRAGLESQILQLQGKTVDLRNRERAALDESNRALYDQINLLTDLKSLTDKLRTAADSAFAAVERAVSGQQQSLRKVYDTQVKEIDAATKAANAAYKDVADHVETQRKSAKAAFDTLAAGIDAKLKALDKTAKAQADQYRDAVDALQAERKQAREIYTSAADALQATIRTTGETVNRLRGLNESLKSTLASLRPIGSEAMDRTRAQTQVAQALALARNGGALPDAESLKGALSVITRPSEDLFGSFEDYARDFYRTSIDIRDLQQIAGSQLDGAQAQLDATVAMKDALDAANEANTARLDAIREALDLANEQARDAYDLQREALQGEMESARGAYDGAMASLDSMLSAAEDLRNQTIDALDKQREGLTVKLEADLSALDDILAEARKQYEAIIGVDSSVKTIPVAIAGLNTALQALAAAMGSGQIATGTTSTPLNQWVTSGQARTWLDSAGAVAVSPVDGTTAIIKAKDGSTFSDADARATVNQLLASGDRQGLAAAAAKAGISGTGADALMGWTSGTFDALTKGSAVKGWTADALRSFVSQHLAANDIAGIHARMVKDGINSASLDALMPWTPGTSLRAALESGLPAFAGGGAHVGGLRIVGERGPELEATGPSRIFNFDQLMQLMGAGNREEALVSELRSLRQEVADLKAAQLVTATNTGRSARTLDRWDIDGQPEQREP